MSHKFKIRQTVQLKQFGRSDALTNTSNVYEIVRLMPADETGEPSYRIKSGATERAVRESDIRSA
jgi:hypothetical protein